MTESEFDALYQANLKQHPNWFRGVREIPSNQDLEALQAALKTMLPSAFRSFVLRYGSGRFAFTSALPLRDIIEHRNRHLSGHQFIPLSDDGTGGWYGSIVTDGKCSEEVYYLDPMEADPAQLTDSDFYAFAARTGFRL